MLSKPTIIILVLTGLVSCAELQVKRDLQHRDDSKKYIKSIQENSTPFDVEKHCDPTPPKLDTSYNVEVTPNTPVISLPNGVKAAGICILVPDSSTALQLKMKATSAMTFFEMTIPHTSILYINKSNVLKDIQIPKYSVINGWTGLQLRAVSLIPETTPKPEYLIFYIHPKSLNSGIDVISNGATIPVPYNPYGSFTYKFNN